jgi:hypothetical protein
MHAVTKYETFQNLEDWLKIVKDTNALGTMPLLALVANKSCVSCHLSLRVFVPSAAMSYFSHATDPCPWCLVS